MFAGIIIRDSRADPRDHGDAETLLAALTPYRQADRTGVWRGPGALLVQALTWNTAESVHEEVPEICPETGRVIVGWVRLDNRAELCIALGLELREALTDPQLILAAHRAWGEKCLDRLEGDFSFVIYDPTRHLVFCARDPLGVRPFFYHLSRDLFVFSSTAAIYPVLRKFDAAPSREWMARYLIGESANPVISAYEQVRKLPPAHMLILDREQASEPQRYFAFVDTAPKTYRRDDRWVEPYRHAFNRAVEARLRSAYPLGAENSGGLDTATIIGHAANRLPGGGTDLRCFSLCHTEREPRYILDLAMYCGIKDNYVLTRPKYQTGQDEYERAFRVMGHPPEHNHALFHIPFFEQCETLGVRTLLSGFGGDEIVTSQAEYVSQELVLAGRYLEAIDTHRGSVLTRPARLAARLRRERRLARTLGHRKRRLHRSVVRREVTDAYGLIGPRDASVEAAARVRTLNEYLLAMPAFRTSLVGRLEGCTLMAASYGIDYRWPMLDRALIAQFLATPSVEKRYRQWGRYLHRRACIDTVPEKILWKERKGVGAIPYLRRDMTPVEVDAASLPGGLSDLIDHDVLAAQARLLQNDHDGDWLAMAPERNNLRAIKTLSMWLNSNFSVGS